MNKVHFDDDDDEDPLEAARDVRNNRRDRRVVLKELSNSLDTILVRSKVGNELSFTLVFHLWIVGAWVQLSSLDAREARHI